MALETMVPPTKTIRFAGKDVEIRPLEGWETLRLLALIDKIRDKIGLSEEEMKAINKPKADFVRWLWSIVDKVMKSLTEEIDLEKEEAQLGPLTTLVYRELGRLTKMSAQDFAKGSLSEQFEYIKAFVEVEEDTALGKAVRGIIARLTNFLETLMMPLKVKPTGGALAGGMTQSSVQSVASIAGPTNISSTSP